MYPILLNPAKQFRILLYIVIMSFTDLYPSFPMSRMASAPPKSIVLIHSYSLLAARAIRLPSPLLVNTLIGIAAFESFTIDRLLQSRILNSSISLSLQIPDKLEIWIGDSFGS